MSSEVEVKTDGTVIVRDGCGGEIRLCGGSIEIRCPEVTVMQSLKAQLVKILEAVMAVAGRPARAVLALAVWAVEAYVPDEEAGHDTAAVSAAPDNVKTIVRGLFDRAVALIPNAFYRRMVQSAASLVLDYFVDMAWDAITAVVTFEAKPVNTAADAAAAATLNSAAP